MRQVLIKGGEAVVLEVPAPVVGRKNILVAVESSCISTGTEVSGLVNSGMPLYQRALKQPENVLLAAKMAREQGVGRTVRQIRGMLNHGTATGYSAAGRVIETGEEARGFSIGDRVACSGAGIANHAEIIDVPVNLAARIPEGLSMDDAATATLGSIALQGVRRCAPTLGETVAVMGLGILGQLTCQLLKLNGCGVIGVEPDTERRQWAIANGLDRCLDPVDEDIPARTRAVTEGFGADAVIVTAAGASDDMVGTAMRMCRKKGRVVLVGDVALTFRREDMYEKELDFLMSTSSGPGRYDPTYEIEGNDYPVGYVRWTENRNMKAFLQALVRREVHLDNLKGDPIDISDVGAAYTRLRTGRSKGLIHTINFPSRENQVKRRLVLRTRPLDSAKISVGLVGAGSFAQGTILPVLAKLKKYFQIAAVISRTGADAAELARQYDANIAATDLEELVNIPDIQLVIIATRHDLHARQALKALSAGKHVFVEKPLAVNACELEEIRSLLSNTAQPPLLMTGFNRRFSPAIRVIKAVLDQRATPVMISYRMNAGYLPPDSWVNGNEGGGRNIGEACHVYDLFNHLVGGSVRSIEALGIGTQPGLLAGNDNFIANLKYSDGSVCSLAYTSLGSDHHPKESMDVFFDQRVITMTDYRTVEEAGKKTPLWYSRKSEKGHLEEFSALSSALLADGGWPISLDDQLGAMAAAFKVEELIRARGQSTVGARA